MLSSATIWIVWLQFESPCAIARRVRCAEGRLIVPGQGINTSSSNPASALLLNMLGAIAQFEHSLIVERVNAGLAAARRRGIKLGRPGTLVFIARPWPNCARKAAQGAPLPRNSESRARRSSNSLPDSKAKSQHNVPDRLSARRLVSRLSQSKGFDAALAQRAPPTWVAGRFGDNPFCLPSSEPLRGSRGNLKLCASDAFLSN